MKQDRNDRELIERCVLQGDESAWESFVRQYSNLVWSAIHRTFRAACFSYSPEDAEDLYSSFFLSLIEHNFRKLRQYHARNNSSLSTWMTVVVVHQVIDHMRRVHNSRMKSLDQDRDFFETLPDPAETAEALLIEQEHQNQLKKTLSSLPPQDQALFDVISDGSLKPDAAARKLGISLPHFYTKKHRLIQKIKKT